MTLNIRTLALAFLFVATAMCAQENQSKTPVEQIKSGVERILTPDESAAGASRTTAEQTIADWKQKPKEAAKKFIERYGQPDEVTARRLVWYNTGQFKRTEIMNEEIQHDFPIPHTDFMEQTIDFRVPPDKFDELAEFDGSVIAERTKGELSARCDKEENNTLALNLAQDVIKGKSPEQAREDFTKTIEQSMKGEKPAMMQKLQFQVARVGTTDSDKATLMNEASGAEQKKSEQK